MGFKNIMGGALKAVLPSIAGALPLPPPFGMMAAGAVGKILGVENLKPEAVPDAIAAAQAKDPDILLKLKQADHEFELAVQKLGVESVEKLVESDERDRASARGRQVAMKDWTPSVLAGGVTIGFFSLLALVAFHQIPASSEKIVDIMTGSLGTAWIGVINFYFGSSSGSAAKTELLAQQLGKQQ